MLLLARVLRTCISTEHLNDEYVILALGKDEFPTKRNTQRHEARLIFTCVAEGESRSRSALSPSVRPSVPKSCHRNSSETTDPFIMKRGM